MANYILLLQFTEEGLRTVKDTTRRAAAAATLARKLGVKLVDMFWTLGAVDVVVIAEAANDETAAAFSLKQASRGHVKIQTLRAFRAREVNAILRKAR